MRSTLSSPDQHLPNCTSYDVQSSEVSAHSAMSRFVRAQAEQQSAQSNRSSNYGLLQHFAAAMVVFTLSLISIPELSAQEHTVDTGPHFIIGGQETDRSEYPWVVALTYNIEGDRFQRQFCGASVIADTWVLTAAHCLFDRRGDVVGPADLNVAINAAFLPSPDVVELTVANLFIHPEYVHAANNPHSDIALIELATSSGIEPVKLSTKATDELIGLQGTVIGWGATNNDDPANPIFPNSSHEVDVPVVSMDVCNAPQSYDNAILANQLCAGLAAGGRDSCVGDSGGPLVVTFEGELQQVGVVSFGFGCALPNFYGIYTDVPFFIGWINQFVFVGEPEFEPEVIEPRTSPVISASNSSGASAGGTSLFGILLLGSYLLSRRRS